MDPASACDYAVPAPPGDEMRLLVERVEFAMTRVATVDSAHATVAGQVETVDRSILAKAFRGELVRALRRSVAPGDVRHDFAKSAAALGRQHVREFLLHLIEREKLSPITHNVHAAALRFLYTHAPHDLIARLVAAVPPPHAHQLRYFGVLSSHSSRRALVVPKSPVDATANKPPPARGDQLELLGESDDSPTPRKRWAWLLAHVFAADVETCPRCSGPMRWAEVATSRAAITRLLAEHDLGPRALPTARAPARVPEQLELGLGFGERQRVR